MSRLIVGPTLAATVIGTPSTTVSSPPEHKTYPDLSVPVGSTVQLPCDLTTPDQVEQPVIEHELEPSSSSSTSHQHDTSDDAFSTDPIQLILWYHGDNISGSPFYSIDARHNEMLGNMKPLDETSFTKQQQQQTKQPPTASSTTPPNAFELKWKHFVASNYSGRARFAVQKQTIKQRLRKTSSSETLHTSSDPIVVSHHKAALLTLNSVKETDSGVYWCRVDYRWTRTTISSVRLNVLASPKRLSIYSVEQIELVNNPTDRRHHDENQRNKLARPSACSEFIPEVGASSEPSGFSNMSEISEAYCVTSAPNDDSTIITLDEGVDQWIACEASGGNPTPSLLWYRNNRKLNTNRAQLVASPLSSTSTSYSSADGSECKSGVRYFHEETTVNRNRSIKNSTSSLSNTPLTSPLVTVILDRSVLEQQKSRASNNSDIHSEKREECSSSSQQQSSVTVSFVQIKAPNRDDIGTFVRCQATPPNHIDSIKSISRLVKIDVNLRPTKVVITGLSAGQFITSGNPIFVSCIASGVRPASATKIVWSLDYKLLLPFRETIYDSNGTTLSELRFVPRATDNGKQLQCTVFNLNLKSTPHTVRVWSRKTASTVGIDPLAVKLANSTHEMHDSVYQRHHQKTYSTNATLSESDDTPIEWNSTTTDDALVDRRTLTVQYLPNITIEVLRDDEHQGQQSMDPGTSQNSPDPKLQQEMMKHAANIKANQFHIIEHRPVQIKCLVDANPAVYRIRWLLDKREILPNNHKGIKITDMNATLHIENVHNINEGRYQCVAYNRVGRSDSREISIHVLRPPRCASPQFSQIESGIDSPVNLFCQVEANPLDNIAIYWETPRNVIFARDGTIVKQIKPYTGEENILDQLDTDYGETDAGGNGVDGQTYQSENDAHLATDPRYIARFMIASKGPRSRLSIVAKSDSDFGLYRCWAENLIGSNRAEPCVFNLTSHASGSQIKTPHSEGGGNARHHHQLQAVQNCLTNGSPKELHVQCGYDANQTVHGGIEFHFLLQRILPDGGTEHFLLANQTNSRQPEFVVKNLKSDWFYQATIYASNGLYTGPQTRLLYRPKKTLFPDDNGHEEDVDERPFAQSFDEISNNGTFESSLLDLDDGVGNNNMVSGASSSSAVGGGGGSDRSRSNDIESKTRRNDLAVEWAESKQSQSHRLGPENSSQDFFSTSSHRFLITLILCLSAGLILVAVLFAISIIVCLRRTKRLKVQEQLQQQQQQQEKNRSADDENLNFSPETKESEESATMRRNKEIMTPSRQTFANIDPYSGVGGRTLAEIVRSSIDCGVGGSNGQAPVGGSLLIIEPGAPTPVKNGGLGPTDISTSTAAIFTSGLLPPGANTAFYRDLISVDSESSYANYTSSEASVAFQEHQSYSQQPQITMQTLNNFDLTPKFLCQPSGLTTNGSGQNEHVSLMTSAHARGGDPTEYIATEGNFQLLTSTGAGSGVSTTEFATLEFPGTINFTPYISLATAPPTQVSQGYTLTTTTSGAETDAPNGMSAIIAPNTG